MKVWTCKKCKEPFTPVHTERVCPKHTNTNCVDCGKLLYLCPPNRQRCGKCGKKRNLQRALQNYWDNKERKQEYDKVRRRLNPEIYREAQARFRENNPGAKNADTQLRRAVLRGACPSWANRFFMAEAYRLAALRTRMLGYRWVVDHIIPLRNPYVCGLHVETNLQVIPEVVNLKKSNSFSLEHEGVS